MLSLFIITSCDAMFVDDNHGVFDTQEYGTGSAAHTELVLKLPLTETGEGYSRISALARQSSKSASMIVSRYVVIIKNGD